MISVVVTLKPKLSVVATLKPKISVIATLRNLTIAEDQVVEYIAQDNIPIYTVVTIDGLRANSSTVGHSPKVLGISRTATAPTFTGEAIVEGEINNPAWTWSVGQNIYLNGTSLSATPPSTGFSKVIGRALGTTTLLVELEESYIL